MLINIKISLVVQVILVFIIFAFSNSGFAARIVPLGKVSIIKDGIVIGEFNQEALLPEGFLLRCEDKCVIQLDDVSMEVEPKTTFSVSPMKNHHNLMVQQGTVYYSLQQSARPLHLDTPIEKATIDNLYANSGKLKGYVRAVQDATEIGVLGGGTMMLEIGSDKMSVFSGEKLTIAIADSQKNASATNKQKSIKYTKKAIEGVSGPGKGGFRVGARSGHGRAGDGGGSGGGGSGGGGSGGGDSGGGDSGGGDSGGGDSGGGDSGGGDKGGGDSGGGKGGGKGGDKGGGKSGGKGGDKGGDKGGGKGGDKGGGKGGGKGGDK